MATARLRIPRYVRKTVKLALAPEHDDVCVACGEFMLVEPGLDSTPTCNPCAQELLNVLSAFVDSLIKQRAPRRRKAK